MILYCHELIGQHFHVIYAQHISNGQQVNAWQLQHVPGAHGQRGAVGWLAWRERQFQPLQPGR